MNNQEKSISDEFSTRATIFRAFATETVDPDLREELLMLAEECQMEARSGWRNVES